MFTKWLKENNVEKFDFSTPLFPKASDRNFWKKKYDPEQIKLAEDYLNFEWPSMRASDFLAYVSKGNRKRQETPHFTRRSALSSLIIGEVLEHKKHFLPDIVDGIFLICEETYWGLSAHAAPYQHRYTNLPDAKNPYIDLFAAETGALIAVAYYILYDELYEYCPDILIRMKYELERRIIIPYTNHMEYGWMGYHNKVNNWNPWILSNILTVFLLTQNSASVFYEGIRKMLLEIENIYKTFPQDGGCEEGATYWAVSGGSLFEFCDQLYIATNGKINFFNDEKMRNIAKYEYRVYIGNGYFTNFADGSARPTIPLAYVLYMFGKRIDDEKLRNLSKELKKYNMKSLQKVDIEDNSKLENDSKLRRRIFDLIYAKEINSLPDFQSEEACILKDIQNTFVRKGSWYYAAKGGHNDESHNHNDVGSFIAYYENEPVLIDPSCGTYTKKTFSYPERYEIWTMQSGWHNLPIINDVEQQPGKNFFADRFFLEERSTNISFAGAYPKEAEIDALNRNILMLEDGVKITDTFAFSKDNNNITEIFVTLDRVRLEKSRAIINENFVIESADPCNISVEYINFSDDPKLIHMWGKEGMNRIKFEMCSGKAAEIAFVLRRL